MSDKPQQVMRVFTRALKLPTLVGKLSEWRIPGGPYTVTQFVGGGLVVVIGSIFVNLLPWAWLVNQVAVLVAGAVTALALRFVKVGGRDPLSASIALVAVLGAPAVGRISGRAPVLPRPRRVRATRRTWVLEELPVAPVMTPAPVRASPLRERRPVAAQAGPTRPTRGAPTGVAALLAAVPAGGGTRSTHEQTTSGTPVAAPASGRS